METQVAYVAHPGYDIIESSKIKHSENGGHMQTTVKKLGVRAVVLMILTVCLSIRWIPAAGAIGPSAIIFWLLAALIFFIPLSLIIIELSLNYKDNGGIYLWTKEALGERYGFYSAWLYWINNVFYYPGLLTFLAANIFYLLGNNHPNNNKHLIVITVIICFWFAVWLNIKGIHLVAKITTLAGIFNFRFVVFLIIMAGYYLLIHHTSATDFSSHQFIPQKDTLRNLSNLSLLMFALSGIELIPTIYSSIDKPEKNLTKAILVSIVLLVGLYITGTITINFILSPKELNSSLGLVASFFALTYKLKWSYLVAEALIFSLIITEFASLNLWLIGPTVMFFHCAPKGIIPNWLQKINENSVPRNALIFQGILVTLIVLFTQYLPTVNSMYMVLVLMATIIYFLPYLFLAISYLRLRHKHKLTKIFYPKWIAFLIASLLFLSVALAIALSFIPTPDLKTSRDILIYEIELIGGPVLFILAGIWLYKRNS